MRSRPLAWLGGALGGLAAYRVLRRRRPAPALTAAADPRADALRARLDETRPAGEDVAAAPAEAADPEERRRAVHAEGEAALREMHDPDG
jgi:hypothetical protein